MDRWEVENLNWLIEDKISQWNTPSDFVSNITRQILMHPNWLSEGIISILKSREKEIVKIDIFDKIKTDVQASLLDAFNGHDDVMNSNNFLWELSVLVEVLGILFLNYILQELTASWKISNISLRHKEWDNWYQVDVSTSRRWRKKAYFWFWPHRWQSEALKLALDEREKLLNERSQNQETIKRRESQKPNIRILENLLTRGIVSKTRDGAYKVRWIYLSPSPHSWSIDELNIDIPWVKNTSRSLNKHSFPDALNEYIDAIAIHYRLDKQEVEELRKLNRKGLYKVEKK